MLFNALLPFAQRSGEARSGANRRARVSTGLKAVGDERVLEGNLCECSSNFR
jgi:hypothetical protein